MMKFLSAFWNNLPKVFRFSLIVGLGLALVLAVFRFAFYIAYDDSAAPLAGKDVIHALWLGFRYDLRVVLIMISPLFVLGSIKWIGPFYSTIGRYVWSTLLTALFVGLGLFYVVDFGHYAYLGTRVDFTAMRFLENALISAQMVWETYPVIWITLGLVIAVVAFWCAVNRTLAWVGKQPDWQLRWWQKPIAGFSVFIIFLFGIHSKFSQYPLRWSDAQFSNNPFGPQLAYNPVHYFIDTMKNGGVTYNEKTTRKYYDVMADYLKVDHPDAQKLNYLREATPKAALGNRPNVVIVIVESLAYYKTSISGNPLNPTPFFKELADQGYLFNRFYTPHTGTARSVFTTITSLPDIELNGTSSRNPLIVDQHTVINDFKGYEKFYFLGGSTSWGNIRGILQKNITGLHVYEEGHYTSPVIDVWGISDLDLFKEANKVFEQQTEPFFAIVQTSGNHRPYTIPEDNDGFEVKQFDEKEIKRYGYGSLAELNAYRFMDHAVKRFIDLVKESHYGNNTLFVFYGDHGLPGSAEHRPFNEQPSGYDLGSNHVPFIIWSPGLIKTPKVFDTVASETDVLPTLASLSGNSYRISTIGRDLFDPRYDDQRYAFKISHFKNPPISLIGKDYYFKTRADGSEAGLYSMSATSERVDLSETYPEIRKKMEALTHGIYETTKYMVHHNKKETNNNH